MTKPMVFNYADHERALEEIAKLKEDIANLQIRCRIAESEKPDRDCNNCKHHKADGCSRWDCEYEPVNMSDVSRVSKIVTDGIRRANETLKGSTLQNLAKPNNYCEDDLISRQDAIDAIERNAYRHTYLDQIIGIVNSLPSADRPTGEWEIKTETDEYGLKRPKLVCSKCEKEPAAWDLTELFEFCPNCGAKMRGEDSE